MLTRRCAGCGFVVGSLLILLSPGGRPLLALTEGHAQKAEQGNPEEPTPAEPAEGEPPGGSFAKLIDWLGRFHPPAVHFPIALLTAAAVAELLRLATGKPAFDAAARYCLWFAALTAVPAGILGWFAGGFHLADGSWVMAAHRWLGTSTVLWAVLVLVLSEVSRRRPDHKRSLRWARAGLLIGGGLGLITGFFGGAVVNGLDHYTWPP